jgi:hypothetical protein
MEFRVFFPRTSPDDLHWADRRLLEFFDTTLNALVEEIDGLGQNPEQREDAYLIGGPRFGVKYRAGKKLQMKVRVAEHGYCIEEWKKLKFGNTGLREAKRDILKAIANESELLPGDEAMIDAGKLISVSKARRLEDVPSGTGILTRELCLISTDNSLRQWMSISVEGKLSCIKHYLLSPHTNRAVFLMYETLYAAMKLARLDVALAADNDFLPVVAGYPTWVRIASHTCRSSPLIACGENMEVRGALGNIEALLSAVEYSPSVAAVSAVGAGTPAESVSHSHSAPSTNVSIMAPTSDHDSDL